MRFVALLRGINVGGSGLLPMKDLAALCREAGCESVRTYIQSGNVVFESHLSEVEVKARLEQALANHMRKAVAVMVRTGVELRRVLDENPFPGKPPAKVAVAFLDRALNSGGLNGAIAPGGEEVRVSGREIYIFYPDGLGKSRLKIPTDGAATTVRNLNTVTRLVAMAED